MHVLEEMSRAVNASLAYSESVVQGGKVSSLRYGLWLTLAGALHDFGNVGITKGGQ